MYLIYIVFVGIITNISYIILW